MAVWRKLGRIYTPSGRHPLLQSHAANPLALHLEGDVFRIFYSGRDRHNRSSVGAVDVDIARATVVKDHEEPFFTYGDPQSSYPDGVSIGTTYRVGRQHFMLFMGWEIPPGSHWRGTIGRLEVRPELTLRTERTAPFIGLSAANPVSLSYPWVMRRGSKFHMWYGSTVTWDAGNGEMLHVINHATSSDGQSWTFHGQAIPHALGVAQAFSRPTVAESPDGLSMWFSYRSGTGESYRIGMAESRDGLAWDLALDRTGIDVSVDGWDSEMICYPFVFNHGDRCYMLYNGNGFGATGFGLALLDG